MKTNNIPVLGFAGFSGSGKTTLIEQLLPMLKNHLRVGLIKHSHHDIELDRPSKDSYRLRHAGCDQLLLATKKRHFVFFEFHDDELREPQLDECLSQLKLDALDLVLVEGFRDSAIPKIEIHRPALDKPCLFKHDPYIFAFASDKTVDDLGNLHSLDLNDISAISQFILEWYAAQSTQQGFTSPLA